MSTVPITERFGANAIGLEVKLCEFFATWVEPGRDETKVPRCFSRRYCRELRIATGTGRAVSIGSGRKDAMEGRKVLTECVNVHLGEEQVGREPVLRVLEGEEHDEGEDLEERHGGTAVHEESGQRVEQVRGPL